MRVLSLFSGGGLGDYGLTLAGMEIVGQVEIDDYCQEILNLRWPDVPKWKDIREVKGKEILERCGGAIDIISGGFPCQPFSTAGRRLGEKDERNLWEHMHRIICEVRPRWVLAENVPGLLSISDGRVFGKVVSDLAQSGYDVEWDCVPASAIGAPHQRDRVWIVAHSMHGSGGSEFGKQQKERPKITNSSGERNVANTKSAGQLRKKQLENDCQGERKRQSPDDINKKSEIRSKNATHGQLRNIGIENNAMGNAFGVRRERDTRWRPGAIFANGHIRGSESEWWKSEPGMGGSAHGAPVWLVRRHIGKGVSVNEQKRAIENLPKLWSPVVSSALWKAIGGFNRFQKAEALFSILREYEKNPDQTRVLLESAEALETFVRGLRLNEETSSASLRSGQGKQQAEKHSDVMQPLPRVLAQDLSADWSEPGWEDEVSRVAQGIKKRVDRLKLLGNGQVVQVVEFIGKQIMEFEK